MAVDPRLLEKLKAKLGIGRSAVYRQAAQQAARLGVHTDIGMLEVAKNAGVNFMQYASSEELQILRDARAGAPSAQIVPAVTGAPRVRSAKGNGRKPKAPGKRVWIVHGRDEKLRRAMFDFVRSLGLEPLEWSDAVKATKSGAPYIGQVLDAAFQKASAVIILLTPDDEAILKRKHWQKGEDAFEKKLTGQARPNVLFEAGIAFGTHPSQTVLVEIGKCRPFSDTAGRLVVKFSDTAAKRKQLADHLGTAGCVVDFSSNAWMTAGDFSTIE